MMEIGNAGLAYHYQAQCERERKETERKSGISKIRQGVAAIFFSVLLLPFGWFTLFFFSLGTGILLLFIGITTHAMFEKEKENEREKSAPPHNIHIHHQPIRASSLITRPHKVVRHSLNHVRSYFGSGRFGQIVLVERIVKENTGSSIDTIYQIYKLRGGAFNHEDFACTIHDLKEHGIIRVHKVLDFVDIGNVASGQKASSYKV